MCEIVPDDLLLGLSLHRLRELINSLPSDAVAIARKCKPKHADLGKLGLDGYANQEIIKMRTKASGLSVCQELSIAGKPGVGRATHFLSWWLGTPLEDVLTALAAYEAAHLEQAPIYWWVCDYSFSQNKLSDPTMQELPLEERLATIIATLGHTVMLLDPWDAPATTGRIWCLWEILQTQRSESTFEVAMSEAQGEHFVRALVEDYDSIATAMSRTDVRTANAFDPLDKARIMAAVEATVGAGELNKRVSSLVTAALALRGRAALEKLQAEARGTSTLVHNLGQLLKDVGDLQGAEPLMREALQARGVALGNRHQKTLASLSNLGLLLQAQGNLEGAEPLLREVADTNREMLSGRHPSTLMSVSNLGLLLKDMGDLEGAEPLMREALQARRETLGNQHPSTLISINNLGLLLKAKGDLEGAEPLYREALDAKRGMLGNRHPDTLISINNLGLLLQAQGNLEGAEPLLREVVDTSRETLDTHHPSTLTSIGNLGQLLKAKGDLEGAAPLLRDVLAACRQTLGSRHPSTLIAINNLGQLLKAKGDLEGAEPLLREDLEACRETLGNQHPSTLTSINNLGLFLKARGDLEGAEPLLREMLETRRETLGERHTKTLKSIATLGLLLKKQGKTSEALHLLQQARDMWAEVLGVEPPEGILDGISELKQAIPVAPKSEHCIIL